MEAAIPSWLKTHPGQAGAPASFIRRVFLLEVPYLAGLGWERVAWSLVLAAAFALNSMLADMSDWTGGHFAAPIRLYVQQFVHWFPKFVVAYVPLMLLATVADNVASRGLVRVAAFAAALVLGVAAIPIDFCVLQLWVGPRCTLSAQYFIGTIGSIFILQFAPLSVIIGLVWLAHRRDASIAAGLHAATIERLALQRQTLEAGLSVIQSRIEPAFLLETLADVSKRCDADPASAERIVDQLVLYLRATLPDAREEGTTLERELQLAASYLELAALRSDGRVRFAIDAPDPMPEVRVAPMVLMPLLAHMLQRVPTAIASVATRAARGSRSDDVGPVMLRVEASIVDDAVQLSIYGTFSRLRLAPDDVLVSELRARLAQLYGAPAVLRIDAGATQVSASITLPHERAGRMEEVHRAEARVE